MSRTVATRIGLIFATLLASSLVRADELEIGYRRDILPLLSDRCFKCHGPDSASRQAGLRLDRPELATAQMESGATAIVPGSPAASALVGRIDSTDESIVMPPADSGKSLSPAERNLLRQWIEQGAVYQKHWAFERLERPPVPEVTRSQHVRNPIDAFVIARLEEHGIRPAPPATKERLIRRLYFDLIGLPPALAEIDAFVADDSSDALAGLLEHLFNSPHYGEWMAVDWLDGARYADSNGYQNDFARSMWPWRDWVIDAFNSHMPYDEFVIDQLAGDLLPHPTLSQRIATGFNRNHRMVTEAGSIEDEWLVENVVDRVETTGTVFLGLTIGCARCHDHKFDPISQREFYQMFAFFHNVAEKGVYVETRGNVPPLVKAMTPEHEAELARLDESIENLQKQFAEQMAGIAPHRRTWLEGLAGTTNQQEPGATASISLRQNTDAHIAVTRSDVRADKNTVPPPWRPGLFGDTASFAGKAHLAYSDLDFPPVDRPFSWAVWIKPAGDGAILSKMDEEAAARGCDLFLTGDGKIAVHIVNTWPSNALKAITKQALPSEKWSHVTATYDGSRKAAGVKIYFDGREQELTPEVDKLTQSFANSQPLRVGKRSTAFPLHADVCDVRLYSHSLDAADVQQILRGSLHRVLASTEFDALDDAARQQFDELLLAYSELPDVVAVAKIQHDLNTTKDERATYEANIPTAMVMEELPEPRETYLLQRGSYAHPDKAERLSPDVPSALPPLPDGVEHNRLGLAKWVASEDNPLTARVIVNRLWQRFFGAGLVKTPENFGVQAEPPSHPELLDWLAAELIESGWDLQHMQRLIVTSYIYRQSSQASPKEYRLDPENRLLARGPRHRLRAEAVRDNALAISGLLVPKIGGPAVMPYQPEGLWEELAGGAHEDYIQGTGDDLYRRSLYTYRKRTVPHPSMSTFDAPSWEICQIKRSRTNTPLQALALLNDVTYVEAARKFAQRIMTEGGESVSARLTFAFRLATGRSPTLPELDKLRHGLKKYEASFRQEPVAAMELISHGEAPPDESLDVVDLAAHTAIANILLNLDETVSKN